MVKNLCLSLIFLFIGVFWFLGFYICFMYSSDDGVFENKSKNENNKLVAMMIETDAKSGEYIQSSSIEWLTDGYVFNTTLSGCENGGSLSWDNVNKKIIMETNISDKCYVYFDVYVEPVKTLSNYVISQYTGTQGENGLYFHDSSLANGANDNSYRYAGGNYILTDVGKALGVTNIFSTSLTDSSALIDYYCDEKKSYFGEACYSTTYYYLIKNDTVHYSSFNDVINNALKSNYITGNVNNYVCFGSDESTCPVDNLYRIIGVFDGSVKLIKSDASTSALLGTDGDYSATYSFGTTYYKGNLSTSDIGGYYWNYNANSFSSNTWSTSLLNITNLNTNYLNNIGSKWANMIDMTTWKVGGNTWLNIGNVSSVIYQNEIVNPVTAYSTDNAIEYSAKIGLMYVSDYGFAAGPTAWTKKIGYDSGNGYLNSAVTSINWMYMGLYEYTISRNASNSDYVFRVVGSGDVSYNDASYVYAVRPVFFLSTSVNYASGDGSASNPIRVSY